MFGPISASRLPARPLGGKRPYMQPERLSLAPSLAAWECPSPAAGTPWT
nr:MAG TPA: hypothetical protein [Bacteriophage sp.]